ncbi:MAG: HD domain-containing protein [Synergistaceae bacterium]|nr:HD domain-containing protein [Synergistota bacterium]NLM71535.1 HD domain-containing protein [Synergistaceae bacterium]
MPKSTLLRPAGRVAISLLLLLFTCGGALAKNSGYRVMMINSYHSTDSWTAETIEGIRQTLLSEGAELDLQMEFLDSKHDSSAESIKAFRDYVIRKYSGRQLDLIVCTGDEALSFVKSIQPRFFPDVPAVFCGVMVDDMYDPRASPMMTGIFEGLDIRGTAELALKLFPRTQNLALVSDMSDAGMGVVSRARRELFGLRDNLNIIDLFGLTKSQLQDSLSALPPATVILMLVYFGDGRGNYFSPRQSSAIVRDSCSYPLFSLWSIFPDEGALGGSVLRAGMHGEKAGQIGLRLLHGEPPADIPALTDRDFISVLNHDELFRFGLSASALPEGAIVVHEPPPSFVLNWRLVLVNAAVIAACVLYISLLLFNERRRRRAARSLTLRKSMWEGLFGNAPEAFVVIDDKNVVHNVNKAFTRLFGYSREESIGRDVDDLVAANSGIRPEAVEVTNRLKRGEAVHEESVRTGKHGKRVEVSIQGSLFPWPDGGAYGYAIYTDISGRVRDEQAMEHHIISESAVAAASRTLLSGSSFGGIPRTLEEMAILAGADNGFFVEFDPSGMIEREALFYEDKASWSSSPHVSDILSTEGVDEINRRLEEKGRLLLDARRELPLENAARARELLRRFGSPLLIMPVFSGESARGWVGLRMLQDSLPSSIDSALTVFCDLMGSVIQQERRRASATENARILEGTSHGMVEILGRTLAMKDPYTVGHQFEVARLARAMAIRGGFDEDFVEKVYYAGLVHDLGKIVVPSSILSKPGRLNDVEFAIIKEHAFHGWEILSSAEFPWPLAEIVFQHHERLDGSGYPNRLKGSDIMAEARLIAVADVVEAMTSHRPYRPGLGIEAALDEVRSGSGKLFDPLAVELCLAVMEDGFLFDEKNYELALP